VKTKLYKCPNVNGSYHVFNSLFIAKNCKQLAMEAAAAHKRFQKIFPQTNSTASTTFKEFRKYKHHTGFRYYNIFSLCAPSEVFAGLFLELKGLISIAMPRERIVYVQAWLNYQKKDEVLQWHTHEGFDFHGYICIEPRLTVTEFDGYTITNSPGLMYLGPCSIPHRVVNLKLYKEARITIGFDVVKPGNKYTDNLGFIPIIIN